MNFIDDFVSIIMPCRNSESYLHEAVNSVLSQTWPKWELLAVDDASQDKTASILKTFAARDSRIILVCKDPQTPGGRGLARNLALDMGKGRYVAFLDSDDLWLPEKLELQLRYMKQHESALCTTQIKTIGLSGEVLGIYAPEPGSYDFNFLLRENVASTSAMMVDRRQCPDLRFGPTKSQEDYYAWMNQAIKGHQVHVMPGCYTLYRLRSFSPLSKLVSAATRFYVNNRCLKVNCLKLLALLSSYILKSLIKMKSYYGDLFTAMKNRIKTTIYKGHGFLIRAARKIIYLCHKAASKLELKNTILFNSMPDFSDSPLEIFNLMRKREEFKDYKFIWFFDHPHKYRHLNSPKLIVKKRIDNPLFRLVNLYYESTARCCIYSHQFLGNMHNKKQLRISISHGSFGIKKFTPSFIPAINYDTFLIHTFLNENKYVDCGLPRNDRLFDDSAATRKILGFETFNKVIIWLPTFKHFKHKGLFHAPKNDFNIQRENDISLQKDNTFYSEVEKALKAHNILLIVKYHHGQDMRYVSSQETDNIKIISDAALSKIGLHLFSLLGATDALITDFSSVAYDYLLTNKQIGFDITDLALYEYNPDIGDPLAYMPGEKIKSVPDFRDFIIKVANGEDNYKEDRGKLLNRLHTYKDNHSTERLLEFVLSKIPQTYM